MTIEHITTVENFFKRWSVSYEELRASYSDTYADDAVWLAAPGIPETHGVSEALALLEQFRIGYNVVTVRVQLKRIAQVGDEVWTERVDDLIDPEGNLVASAPLAGILTLNEAGKITSHRDYWDTQELQKKLRT